MDVLGVEDRGENDQLDVLREYKDSVARREDGRYEVSFPWIPGATLPNTNETLGRKRLENVERKLSRNEKLKEDYNGIIEEQLRTGVTAKVRTRVQDPTPWLTAPLMTVCLLAPPLQPLLWDIMVRARMSLNLLLGDIERAFLQISVKGEDRDSFRFLFNVRGVEKHLRSTRVPFGVEASPFLPGATL